ncbi:ABC transporter permease [Christiangramia sediminis]|uniref:ABC transporter permease n=1 Tax=Christiangramia sediminis TaxID=2881336 RepID=A0A9X1LHN4_9FLAO|nr:ABC transporter permease [Christiangramia sediminis]MCB7480537.1 ABC transporter permease [Christiangramia sediminis]
MLKNFIKISWRRIKADKTFSFINILGLSIGLTITILLFLFVLQERSFDTMYANKERIYRVIFNTSEERNNEVWATVPAALKPAAAIEIPEIQKSARLWDHDFGKTASIEANNQQFTEQKLYYADAEFLDIFQPEFIYGNSKSALERPNTIVISESTAEKYFGKTNPIGQMIGIDNKQKMEITGVYMDFPANSSLDGNMIASFNSIGFYDDPTWGNASFETYFLLNEQANRTQVTKKMQQLVDANVEKEHQWYTLSLQPLEKMHLYSSDIKSAFSSKTGSIEEVRNFSLLAILILLIACINYMNLATARSQKSTKDVGINKTLGASSKILILRFFTETGFVTLLSIFLALIFTVLAIPFFESIVGVDLSTKFLWSSEFAIALIAIWMITTLIAGSFPAFHLSKFSPMEVIRSGTNKNSFTAILRKGLVIVQFSASVILIISAIVIYNQLEFMRNKNLGYNPDNTVAISIAAVNSEREMQMLRNEFESLSEVSSTTMTQGFPGISVSGRSLYRNMNSDEAMSLQTNRTTGGIVETLQLKLLAGKDLPATKQEGDSIVDVLLNKKAVEFLGMEPQEAIGKNLIAQLGPNAYVIGVVDDFNFSSLRSPIGGYAFNNGFEPLQYMLVRFESEELPATVEKFRSKFAEVVPSSAFDYTFLDKNVEQMYSRDRRTATVALIFAGLAIFVACLGLFGLAAFMAEQRTKEIGIRKILGASITGIIGLLSKDFVKLVFFALIIAFPLAYWFAYKWLQEFVYRIEINWQIFLYAGLIALLIAITTVSFQALKAAISNPVNSLKND